MAKTAMQQAVEGNTISFWVGKRHVNGIVQKVVGKGFLLLLQKEYIGKNETWESGEVKHFYTARIKKMVVLNINQDNK